MYSWVTNNLIVKRILSSVFLILLSRECDMRLDVIQVRHQLWDLKKVKQDQRKEHIGVCHLKTP